MAGTPRRGLPLTNCGGRYKIAPGRDAAVKKGLYWLLFAVFALTLLLSGSCLIYKQIEGRAAREDYGHAEEVAGIAGLKEPPSASAAVEQDAASEEPAEDPALTDWLESMGRTDIGALRQVNSEVLAWIAIPGSELSYPLMACADNSFYLNHTWLGVPNAAGAIFLDGRCAQDFSGFNTIIYGHRMHNDMMFGSLRFYDSPEYWESHPTVYIFEPDCVRHCDIFAAYETAVESPTYSFGLTEAADKQAVIDHALKNSVLETGIVPTPEDLILTLSTCTQTGGPKTRWVVQAVLRE